MKNSLALLLFLVPLKLFCQIPWPISPFNTQHNLTGKVGEYRNTGRFHKGVDIVGASQDVYAMEDGVVAEITNVGTPIEQVRVGTLWYTHIVSEVVVGQDVNAGVTKLGSMYTLNSFPIHVHLEDVTRDLLSGNISPYVDDTPPTINAYSFRRNGHTRLNTTDTYSQNITIQSNDYTLLYGKVDLIVNASDPSGANTYAPSLLSYQIFQKDGVTAFEGEIIPFQFGGTELDNSRANTCFGAGTTQSNFNYVLTSNPNNGVADRYLNTILKQNVVEDWSNNENLDARFSGEANYPDGLYQIEFKITDVDENDNPNSTDEESVRFLIDNFRPYIKSLKIYRHNSNGPLLRHNEWVWEDDHLEFGEFVNGVINNVDNLYIEVEASEPLQYVYLKIPSVFFVENNVTPIEGSQGKKFGFFVNHVMDDGIVEIEIEGDDCANNGLQSDPAVISIRQDNTTWLPAPVEGPDLNHSFIVGSYLEPIADFAPLQDVIYIGEEVDFLDQSENDPDTWLWDFGFNNKGSDEQNPLVVFPNAGTYQVKLTVTNSLGSSVKTGTITVEDPGVLTCNFNASPRFLEKDEATNFSDNSYANNMNIVSWQWWFEGADQTTSEQENPTGIAYSNSGSYDVELTVTDSEGNSDTQYMENYIFVYDPDVDLEVSCNAPISAQPNQTVYFPTWVFDGQPPYHYSLQINGTEQTADSYDEFHNFQYTLGSAGTYYYIVTVTDGRGISTSISESILVGSPGSHHVDFSWEFVDGEPGLEKEIILTDLTSGGMAPYTEWYWDWGNDPGLVESNGPGFTYEVISNPWLSDAIDGNPQTKLKFTEFGTYPITLTVSDAEGWPEMVTKYISIEPEPSCITLYHHTNWGAITCKNKMRSGDHIAFESHAEHIPLAKPDNSCKYKPWGELWTDREFNISNLRWKVQNSNYEKYVFAMDSEIGAWYANEQNWIWDTILYLSEGKYTVQVEVWNRMHEECYEPNDLEPINRELNCWYDAGWKDFIVVDCEKVVNINSSIASGSYDDKYAGFFNFSPTGMVTISNGAVLNYEACEQIDLLPGLDIDAGSDFTAKIDPLDGSVGLNNKSSEFIASVDDQQKLKANFSLYPNPNTGTFYLSFNEYYTNKDLHIMVFNHQGKLVFEQKSDRVGDLFMDLGHLNDGLYFVNVNGVTKKMLIIN
ncbi:MAG: PKD domain-containing protein [Bacteroidales bacterium]|nr:PKD domain-containing protein [Bacteroidales bacterium]